MDTIEHKTRPTMTVAELAFSRLKTIQSYPSEIIRYPSVFSKICSSMCLRKKEAWSILFELERSSQIKIIRGHGIRLMGCKE